MSPCELERAIAQATGETRREIRRRGFQPLVPDYERAADDDEGLVIDWDVVDAERLVLFP